MPLKMDNMVCGRRPVSQLIQFKICLFKKNINLFRHLKLEIALAIPAANDEKYNIANSAGQGLRNRGYEHWIQCCFNIGPPSAALAQP